MYESDVTFPTIFSKVLMEIRYFPENYDSSLSIQKSEYLCFTQFTCLRGLQVLKAIYHKIKLYFAYDQT